MSSLAQTVERLCKTSVANFIDPFSRLEWPDAMALDQWFMSPELISLYGTDEYAALSEAEAQRLSFYECINFFSLNINGERALIEGLTSRLYRDHTSVMTPYLHHFVDEENKHMYYFGRFCTKYAGKVYRDKKLVFPREYAPGEEELLFFAKVMVFEELVDVYNRRMSKDERLVSLAREINWLHHFEETRHLSFGRLVVKELFEQYAPQWSAEVRNRVATYLAEYLVATWKEFYNPDAYRDAGFTDALAVRERAYANDAARAHRADVSARCIRVLRDAGIFTDEEITL